MDNDNTPTLQHIKRVELIKETQHKPNQIRASERLVNLFSSVILLAYGTYGLWINDLYIPAKRVKGTHLHDLPAWVMFGAFISACLVMISVCIDHYDKRNNEIKYQRFASIFKNVAWIFFALSVSMQITSFDGGLKNFLRLIPVFAGFILLLIWASRQMEKRVREEKLQIETWKEEERSELAAFLLPIGLSKSSSIRESAQTMQYTAEPYYIESKLQALFIKRILRNVAGEYFYWVWSSNSPRYFKQITQVNAKILLKKDYLAP
jgi:hypothetical protein